MKTIDEIDQNEDPKPATGPRDMKFREMVGQNPGDVGVVVTGIRTTQDRDLGVLVGIVGEGLQVVFQPFAGTYEDQGPVTAKERQVLAYISEIVLQELRLRAIFSLMGIGGEGHECKKCGKCGRKFDADGELISQAKSDDDEDDHVQIEPTRSDDMFIN